MQTKDGGPPAISDILMMSLISFGVMAHHIRFNENWKFYLGLEVVKPAFPSFFKPWKKAQTVPELWSR